MVNGDNGWDPGEHPRRPDGQFTVKERSIPSVGLTDEARRQAKLRDEQRPYAEFLFERFLHDSGFHELRWDQCERIIRVLDEEGLLYISSRKK